MKTAREVAHAIVCERQASEWCHWTTDRTVHAHYCDTLTADLEARDAEHEAEAKRLKGLIDRDGTGLAAALVEVKKRAEGGRWISEGRGSYKYDEDDYRKETGWLVADVVRIAAEALRASGNLANEAFHPTEALATLSRQGEGDVVEAAGSAAGLLEDFANEHDYCLACHMGCPLSHDHYTEDERNCILTHADDCITHRLRARLRDAEALLRLFVDASENAFDPNCAWDNGKPCYTCRAHTFLTSPVDLGGPRPGAVPRAETCGTCGRSDGTHWEAACTGHPPTPSPPPGPTKGP